MRTKFIKAFSLVLAILMISVSLAPLALANSKINDARQSVLRVATPTGSGTAFVIAQDGQTTIMVTNLHVVSGYSQVTIIPDNLAGSWITAQVSYLPDGLDLVLLTTTSGLANRPVLPLTRAENAAAADNVWALGFPGASDNVLDEWYMMHSSIDDVTITNGVIGRTTIEIDYGVRAIQSNVPITFGNSGGPLLNERAEVVGVNTWIYSEGAYGISYSIHIDYIIDECIARGIPYVSGGSSFFEEYLWLIAIVGGILLLGIVAIIIVATKKKPQPAYAAGPQGAPRPIAPGVQPGYPQQQGYQQAGQPGQPVQPGYQQPGQPGYQQPQAPRPAQPQPAAAPAAPPPPARQLFSTKGHLAGNSFPIQSKLSIGRDPQRCQVIYPSDTKGISSLHCEVMVQQGGVFLTDKGSTYGTFLAGGQKLAANQSVMLQPGAIFYLADPANEFKIT